MSDDVIRTRALTRFMRNEHVVMTFIYLNVFLEGQIPFLLDNLPEERKSTMKQILEQIDYERATYKFKHLQAEIILSRTVDNFNSYIIDILRGFFRAYPESITEKVKKMPAHKVEGIGIDENKEMEYFALIQAEIIQERGFDEVINYLTNELGIYIDVNTDDFKQTSHASIRRNIIAHNRGRMNRRFLKKLGQSDLTVDIPMITSFNEANAFAMSIRQFTEALDQEMIKKYGVEIFSNFAPYPTLTEGVVFPYN